MSAWEGRPQGVLQMGNGTLLATFDAQGEVGQLYSPHLDTTQSRLGAFRTSVLVPADHSASIPELIRIEPGLFEIRLKLAVGSQILDVEYHHRDRPLRLARRLALHPTESLILDSWKISGEKAALLHESIPWIGHSTSAHCSLYHPSFGGLVHHRGRRWIGIMARGHSRASWSRVGHLPEHDRFRLWTGENVYVPLQMDELKGFPNGGIQAGWDQVVQGPTTWGTIACGPGEELEFAIICAESERHLGRLLELTEHVPKRRYYQMIEAVVKQRYAPAEALLERIGNPSVRHLCERSIDVLHSLQDARTGALMAAAEVDPQSRVSGGYGFSWPRDGAYLASALGAFGFHDRVERYFQFLVDTQDPSGAWWQRYLATGHAGPSWGRIQIDEPASVIWLAWLHYSRTGNLFWLERFWPTLERGLGFLKEFHSSDHPMGLPSHDLWEERMGIHAYSLGAVSAAFLAGGYLARELSDRQAQRQYHEWSRRLRTMLKRKFIESGHRSCRSFVASSWDFTHGGGYWDETTDSSLLGLISPFRVLRSSGTDAGRIVDEIRSQLWCAGTGGVLRYERDQYRGGNPWILTTLWLAQVELERGRLDEARECFQWALSKATHQGMLAEQVQRDSGQPFWVIPLGWSHALFLNFVRQVLDRKLEARIWV